jgi:Carboxypeptidase regulatory-like domain
MLLAGLAGNVLAQTGNASLGGIVEDPSKALIPGVTITAKNVDTAVTTTQITNESGVYNFPVLQPGSYEISAELPGFKKGVQRAELPYAGQVRVNFTLEVGQTSETVEVTVSAEASLKESSASISDVLTQKKIETMPMVGNNVLDLLTSLPGLAISQTGNTALDTVNGLNLDSINVTRDGLSINDGRYAAGSTSGGTAIGGKGRNLLSDTTLLPDLIGEVRLVLSPVDAELGRGNAQIQIRTRSGTNKFNGSAAWYTRNSALDANSWLNNHTPFTDTATGVISNSTQKPWRNNNQYTVAYGGPVKIPHVYDGHNKTFFYSLWEQNISSTRQIVYTNVLTDTARLGVFRYFPYWSPEGYLVNSTITNQKVPVTASTASWVAVDVAGNPVAPPAMPDGSAYPYKLTCFSVFGNKRLDNSGALVPFTAADCPGGTAILPQSSPSANGLWDVYRSTFDSTGFIKRLLTQMPRANFFGQLDGLNLAQYGFMQRRKGSTSSATAQQTTDPYANNKQINIKIDHNFNANHKAAFNYTRQRDSSDGNVSSWPDGPAGIVVRRPDVFTANVTSTLSSHIINQATFGMNRNFNSTLPAYLSTDPEMKKLGEQYLIPGGKSVLNPSYSYLVRVASSSGRVGSGTGPLNGAGVPTSSTSWTSSILYSYGDTVSWSRGKHAFKFGAELRMPQNAGNGGNDPYPSISLGNNGSATQTVSPFGTTTNFPELLGLQSNSLVTGANPRSDVTNLLYFLNGSVNTATQFYYINNYLDLKNNRWQDYSTSGIRMRNQIHREWSAFAKDDYKVTRRLTLNLGVRWEFYASPYIEGGFTSTVIGGGYGAFGAARTVQGSLEQFNQNPFALWLHPGNLFMTGYGSNPFAAGLLPEDCKVGVQQTGLPKSTCDPNSLSSIQFVGPGSPNPDLKAIPEQYHNFGPAIGFAYTLPWFGEGKTTIRGGYQQTFQRVLVNNSGEANGTDTFIGQIPGSQRSETTNVNDAVFQAIINPTGGTGRALTLADFANLVPVRPQVNPGGVLPLGARAQNIAGIYDSNYKGPYTQNIVLSVTRQINPKFTADVRYTGTLGRRLDGGVNLDTPNVYHNPELLQALLDARAGTCTANAAGYKSYIDSGINPCDINGDPVLLDQMFAGLNLNPNVNGAAGTGTFGNVGTVNAAGVFQSGAAHLRRSSTFQTNLANGDFNQLFTAVTGNLLTLLPTGLRNLPNDPSTGLGYFTVTPSMRTLRNGCDRLGDGFTIVQQNTPGATQNANTGAPIPLRCFPEDYVITNSQFSGVTYHANWNNSYYHSLQTQLTARPVDGVSIQATWVWSKLMGTGGTYVDPVNRQLNYYAQANNPQAIRMNGTIELPLGPNKLFFNNASGWIARAIEKWQTSFIFNGVTSGLSSALPQTNHFYGNPGYTIASPNWKLPEAHLDWSSGSGTIFGNAFTSATDPQCVDRSQVTAGDKMGTSLQSACTLLAVAQRNSDGTPGDVMLKYTKPGEVGNLGFGNFKSFGQWTLDMSASKTFSAGESRSFQIRVDATNVLNHPLSAAPSFQAGTFGVINAIGGVNKTGERAFQGQLRVNF